MKAVLLGAAVAALSGSAASAHHSFAMFDRNKTLTLEGVVKEFQWTSPHAWVQVMVPNPGGGDTEWSLETGPPGVLTRSGWTSRSLKPGDRVTVTLNPLKDGSPSGSLNRVVTADGKVVGGRPAN